MASTIHFDAPYLTIHWESDTRCVRMEWKQFTYGETFRRALDHGLDRLRQEQASCWLADCRNLGVLLKADQQWTVEDWFPRALAAGLRRLAIVEPLRVVPTWSVQGIMREVRDPNIQVAYFSSLEAARAWLMTVAAATEPQRPAAR